MRVLWATAPSPLPLTDGNRHRHFHLLREVARRHQVTLVCPALPEERAALQTLAPEITVRPVSPVGPPRTRAGAIRRGLPGCLIPAAIEAMTAAARPPDGAGYDVAFGALWAAPALRAAGARRLVIDDQNVEAEKYARIWRHERLGVRKLARALDIAEVARYECAALHRADAITACSGRDAARLRLLSRGRPAHVIPNGVDLERVRPGDGPRAPAALVFVGALGYEPNADAARQLLRVVMPQVWARRPDAEVTIVGREPPTDLRAAAGPRVTVTGAVDSVLPYLHRATMTVLPLRSGSGTRLKLLEAMAAGTPVVSTTLGAEGLGLIHRREAWLAERTGGLADGVLALLGDPTLAETLAGAARARVEREYGWGPIGDRLAAALEAV